MASQEEEYDVKKDLTRKGDARKSIFFYPDFGKREKTE